jgi:DNA-binding transcriptional regulator LsrR (DeoR family)
MRRNRASQPTPPSVLPASAADDFQQRQLLARVAWMYFVEGRRQEDIATKLQMNRMRVNRLLIAAREQGIVRIEIDSAARPIAELEAQLVDRYGLRRALIVPTGEDDAQTFVSIGVTLGGLLNTTLCNGMTVGTHRGQTCYSMFQGLKSSALPEVSVVSLQGDFTATGQVLPQEVVARLAVTLGASCHYLAAPTYASSVDEWRVLTRLPMVRSVLDRAQRCDLAVLSPGALVDSSKRILKHVMTDRELAEVRAAGGVGSLLGAIYDREGGLIEHEINARRIGVDPSALMHVPDVTVVGIGAHKVDIMRVALKLGWTKTLITDELTARAILL